MDTRSTILLQFATLSCLIANQTATAFLLFLCFGRNTFEEVISVFLFQLNSVNAAVDSGS